jgi:hypothetical protein
MTSMRAVAKRRAARSWRRRWSRFGSGSSPLVSKDMPTPCSCGMSRSRTRKCLRPAHPAQLCLRDCYALGLTALLCQRGVRAAATVAPRIFPPHDFFLQRVYPTRQPARETETRRKIPRARSTANGRRQMPSRAACAAADVPSTFELRRRSATGSGSAYQTQSGCRDMRPQALWRRKCNSTV